MEAGEVRGGEVRGGLCEGVGGVVSFVGVVGEREGGDGAWTGLTARVGLRWAAWMGMLSGEMAVVAVRYGGYWDGRREPVRLDGWFLLDSSTSRSTCWRAFVCLLACSLARGVCFGLDWMVS